MRISKELKVGLLVVICGTVLYLGFDFLKGRDFFSTAKKYYVVYDDIKGLTVSNPVVLHGYAVGRVEEIRFVPDSRHKLVVTLKINSDVVLNDSTVAVLGSQDLLSGKAILLELGNGGRKLKTGDTLVSQMETGVLDKIQEIAVPVIDQAGQLITNVNDIFADGGAEDIKGILSDLNETMGSLKRTMYMIEGGVRDNRRKVDSLIATYTDLGNQLRYTVAKAKPLMDKLNMFADSLNSADLKGTLVEARKTVDQLNGLLSKVNNGEGTMGQLVNDKRLYENLNATVEDLDYLVTDLQANPKRYVHVSVFGGGDKSKGPDVKRVSPRQIKDQITVQFNQDVPKGTEFVLYRVEDDLILKLTEVTIKKEEATILLPPEVTNQGSYLLKIRWAKDQHVEEIYIDR